MKDFIKKFAREISVFGLVLVVFLGLFIYRQARPYSSIGIGFLYTVMAFFYLSGSGGTGIWLSIRF